MNSISVRQIKRNLLLGWVVIQCCIVLLVWTLLPRLQGNSAVLAEVSIGDIDHRIEMMTVREKVGQMMIVSVLGTEPGYYATRMIRDRNIGGVCFLEVNVVSEVQTKRFILGLQGLAKKSSQGLPLFVFVDQEGGTVSRIKSLDPYDIPQYDIQSVPDAANIALERARVLKSLGFTINLAPVMDYAQGKGYIGSRSFNAATSSEQVEFGKAMIEGYRQGGLLTAPKHYIGHAEIAIDPHYTKSVLLEDQREIQRKIWMSLLSQTEVDVVLISHTADVNDATLPHSLNSAIYQELREHAGEDVLLIPDELRMLGVTYGIAESEAAVIAVQQGADMVMTFNLPEEQAEIYNRLVQAVENGEITEERINESVRRILMVKKRYFYPE